MNKSDSIAAIAPALVKAQAEIKAALKDATNPHFKSKYADLSSVVEAVKAPLLKNGIAFLQGIHDAVDGVAVETMLLHTSGEWISSTLRLPATKQDAQGYGSAITYGRRYGLQAICGVPAEDDDGNAATASTTTITPTSGAMQRVDPKRRPVIADTATLIKDYLAEERDFDAFALCEEFTDADEKVYLWTFLDSKARSRIKAQAEASKKQQTDSDKRKAA
jgi:hypothetical protein